jgi:hypothetical protein
MPLITCPACGRHPVSDQAPYCPGCGHPIAAAPHATLSAAATPQGGKQAVLDIAQTIRDAQKQLLSASEADALAERIAMQKQSGFHSTQEFIDASLGAGVLILSNNDATTIKDLSEQQKKGFKALFAVGCDTLDDSLANDLNGFCNLRELDLSYSGLTVQVFERSFNGGRDLCKLETLYLRRYGGMELPVWKWLEQCSRLHSLFVDGNPELSQTTATVLAITLPSLQVLSIVECIQLRKEGVEAFNPIRTSKRWPACRLIGP